MVAAMVVNSATQIVPEKVFILDDEKQMLTIMSAFVSRYSSDNNMNIKIKACDDAVEGLFELTAHGDEYSAILLDVRAPRVPGDEIYYSLSHANPGILERILFVTGFPSDLLSRFPDAKLNILPKPFKYNEMVEKLNALLAS